MKATSFATLLERFFIQRLMQQRQVSPHTVSSYRDTFRLLLHFADQRLHKPPSHLTLEDIDAPLVTAFLDDLEANRKITARSRNLRLTAIRSFFQYASYEEPAHASQIQLVLAIPGKRCLKGLVNFLDRAETGALLAAPDPRTWYGRRDHALLLVAVQTGLRLSEITGLRREDLNLGTAAHVRCVGKGRRERCTPLTKQAVTAMKAWLPELAKSTDWLFPNAQGGRLSADAVQRLGRVFRVDSELRSYKHIVQAAELVRNGRIGKIQKVVVGVPGSDVGCEPQPEMPVPPELDYERWQGPAPRAPYTERRVLSELFLLEMH